MTTLPGEELARAWRDGLADPAAIHFDAAGCSAPSAAVVDAVVAHLRREAAIGGYAAAVEAEPAVAGLRARLGALVGLSGDAVALAPNATVAFTTLLAAWPLRPDARIGVLASEYASNRMALDALAARRPWTLVALECDGAGRLDLDGLDATLRAGLDLITFPVVASHRGVVQPAFEAVRVARAAGVPVLLDVAQAAGHVPLIDVGAAAYVGTARKWLRGPRGTGWLAATPSIGSVLVPEYPGLAGLGASGIARLAIGEAAIASQVGLAVALDELEAANLDTVTARIADLGATARARLDGVRGWRVQEPSREQSGIVTLAHPDHDPTEVARRLLAEGIVTSAIPTSRAPGDLAAPVLRVSLHAYCSLDDLDALEFSLRR